eukprot:Blabericola_migrator_1__1880@NODE_1510_length_4388_cov_32_092803_g992_i0_p2_GENE_NODE_1510_length_4388_cov_32_092803_g992_i0NODE_1510_length_4388_cov_32_092803_g992_i0_p2_ORF_typecomplete_len291_score42_71_NODE_1510_length_4388_cov_32_092803_g992_i010491921
MTATISPIVLHVLPFLTAAVRLRVAQAGSSALRKLILSQLYERKASLEYFRMSLMGSIFDTLNEPPFKLKVKGEGTTAYDSFQKIREERFEESLKTWHAVCARFSFFLQPKVDKTWVGTQSNFEALGERCDVRFLRYSKLCDVLEERLRSKDCEVPSIMSLSQSGFPDCRILEVAPLKLIRWCNGSTFSMSGEMKDFPHPSREFSCGSNAREGSARTNHQFSKVDSQDQIRLWRKQVTTEWLRTHLASLGFKPQIDSTDPKHDESGVVAVENEFLYGNMKVWFPLWDKLF